MTNPIENPQWMWGYSCIIDDTQKIISIAANKDKWSIYDDNIIYHAEETFKNSTRENIKSAKRFAKKHFNELRPL
jgi:hypothetical protein